MVRQVFFVLTHANATNDRRIEIGGAAKCGDSGERTKCVDRVADLRILLIHPRIGQRKIRSTHAINI